MGTRILFGGMISSGKSTLVCSIYHVLAALEEQVSLYELDVWSDTHDCILGRKSWSERRKRTPQDDDAIHAEFRAGVERFSTDPAGIVLGDLPGRELNRSFPLIRPVADLGVVLYREPIDRDQQGFFASSREGWQRLMRQWGIPEVLEVKSVRPGEQVPMDTFAIDGLDRNLLPHHPEIHRLAQHLLERTRRLQATAA